MYAVCNVAATPAAVGVALRCARPWPGLGGYAVGGGMDLFRGMHSI